MQHSKPLLVVITGPTAIGKTALCIRLAKRLGVEILSCDARQFYQELRIGVARPNEEELGEIRHHFVAHRSIHAPYSAGDFDRDVQVFLQGYYANSPLVIMTGGSGLYIKAVLYGFDEFPEIPQGYREKLETDLAQRGIESLQQELAERDPAYHAIVDLKNPRRLIRALEVCRSTGQPYSSFRSSTARENFYDHLLIGLHMNREELYSRIDRRVHLMMQEGLLEEAKSLLPFAHLNALQTVGYQELFRYFRGEISEQEAIAQIQQNSRRYAKRQMTWIRKQAAEYLFKADQEQEILSLIRSKMEELES